MGEEEIAARSRNIHINILQWQLSPAETFLQNLQGTETRRTSCCRLRSM